MSKPKVPSRPKVRDEARRARLDVYRQHVLAAAEAVLAEHGFDAAKLQEISQRAGLSMGTIYAVFPGKLELLEAIFELRGREILALAEGAVAAKSEPWERLLGLAAAYIDFFVAHPDFLKLHLREGRAWIMSPANGAADRAVLWRSIHELQAGIFRDGIAAGDFAAESPDFLAKVFSALDQVVLADWAAGGMQQTRDELVARIHGLLRRAFGAAPAGQHD